MVACAVCGLHYDASARTYRDIRKGKVEPRCVLHRKRNPRPATVLASYRRDWLNEFTNDDLREIGASFDSAARSIGLSREQLDDPIKVVKAALVATFARG